MSRGATLDIEGKEVSEEYTAKGLGFVDVEAFRWWKRTNEVRDRAVEVLVGEVANLRSRVTRLEGEAVELSRRITSTGTEIIGGSEP